MQSAELSCFSQKVMAKINMSREESLAKLEAARTLLIVNRGKSDAKVAALAARVEAGEPGGVGSAARAAPRPAEPAEITVVGGSTGGARRSSKRKRSHLDPRLESMMDRKIGTTRTRSQAADLSSRARASEEESIRQEAAGLQEAMDSLGIAALDQRQPKRKRGAPPKRRPQTARRLGGNPVPEAARPAPGGSTECRMLANDEDYDPGARPLFEDEEEDEDDDYDDYDDYDDDDDDGDDNDDDDATNGTDGNGGSQRGRPSGETYVDQDSQQTQQAN
jgi:hypothetical protein